MAIDYPIILPSDPGAQILLPMADDFDIVTEGFDGSQQVQSFPGERWQFEADYPPMTRDEAAELVGAFLACRRRGTFLFGPERGSNPRGTGPGVWQPSVFTGSPTSSISTGGWPPSTANVLKRGDWIQISKNLLEMPRNIDDAAWVKNQLTQIAPQQYQPSAGATDAYIQQDSTETLVAGRTFTFWIAAAKVTTPVTLDLILYSINHATIRARQTVTIDAGAHYKVTGVMDASDTGVRGFIGGSGTWVDGEAAVQVFACGLFSPDGAGNSLHQLTMPAASDVNGGATLDVYPAPHAAIADLSAVITSAPKGVFRLVDSLTWSEDAAQYGLKVKMMEAY